MKKLLILIILLIPVAVLASGKNLRIEYNVIENDVKITGYKIYEKLSGEKYNEIDQIDDPKLREYIYPRILDGLCHTYVMTALSTDGESEYSNEYTVCPTPNAPNILTIYPE